MAASQSGVFSLQEFSDIGAPLVGGRLYTYVYGTTTHKTAYTDKAGTIPHTYTSDGIGGQYIALNARGELPAPLYLASGSYDIALKTSTGATVWTRRADPGDDASDSVSAAIRADLASTSDASKGAGLGGFNATLNYAAGTIGAALSDVCLNVKMFPWLAKLDGVTNDTAAIQAAINTGHNVFIPQGVAICDALTMATPGQTLFGSGNLSVLQPSSGSINLITVSATYVTICDLRLNGVSTSDSTTSFAIFTSSAAAAQYLRVERVVISGTDNAHGFNNAIKFDDGCNHGSVLNSYVERLWGGVNPGKGYGVLIGNATGCRVIGNRLIATTNAGAEDGNARGRHAVYPSSGASYTVVANNYIEGFLREGISQDSTLGQPVCSYNVYSNNTLKGCAASVSNTSSGAIGIYRQSVGAVISANTIQGSGQRGITLDSLTSVQPLDTVISGNAVMYAGGVGIMLNSTSRAVVTGNNVYESGQLSAGSYPNIYINSDGSTVCDDVLVTGNNSAGATKARSAITVNSSLSGPTNVRLMANKFMPCQSYTLELNGVAVEVDGRIQFRQDSVSVGSTSNGAATQATYTVSGAAQGDIVTVSHTSSLAGWTISGYASAANTVIVTYANFTGGSASIGSGTLRIDVWKRSAPF